jgi:hypothetical protein
MAWQVSNHHARVMYRLSTFQSVKMSAFQSAKLSTSAFKLGMSNKDSPPVIRKAWFQPAFPVEKLTQ